MIIRHVERATAILMALCLLAPGGTHARTSGRAPVRIRVLERTAQPLLVSDRPWEAFTLSYSNVIKTGGMWQLWYGSYDPEYKYDCDAYLCYARSSDGVQWTKTGDVFSGARAWDSKVICDPHVEVLTDRSVGVWFGGGDVASPDENLHGQIGRGILRMVAK